MSHSPHAPRPGDRVRQVSVTVAEVLCVLGTLVGTGVIGTRVAESSGGALSADATHLAPAGPAFSIWSVIYAGLLAYTVWQWLPSQTSAARHRAIGWLVVPSMLLNALWLLVTQVDQLWLSVVVIVALLVTLVAIVARLERDRPDGLADRVVTDGTFGLYLGWVSVAVCANIAATLAASGFRPGGALADGLSVAILAVVALVGVGLALRFGARWAVTIAICWGLAWLAYGRLADSPHSGVVATAAILAAIVIAVATLVATRRRSADDSTLTPGHTTTPSPEAGG